MYLAVLTAGTVFYLAYQEWFAWFVLMVILLLPWFSLAVSLSAMLSFSAEPECPAEVDMETPAEVWLMGQCGLPVPPFKGRIRLRNLQTGAFHRYRSGGILPTEHCGGFSVTAERVWVYDYLGLIGIPVRKKTEKTAIVRPLTAKMEAPPDLSRYLARSWRPKPGGGYAENHELRLYRPGDNLHQIHWKLSAKTGNLIIREPMEAQQDAAMVSLELSGNPEQVDQKLGRLLAVSRYLAENGVKHRIFCYTGTGMEILAVANEQEAQDAVDMLLQLPLAPEGEIPSYPKAVWRYHLGGDGNEA